MFKPLLKSWRSGGIPIAIFLDDGLGGGTDPVSAKINSLIVHFDLLKAGFLPNEGKSQWEPIQIINSLGVIVVEIHTLMISHLLLTSDSLKANTHKQAKYTEQEGKTKYK